MSQRTTHNRNPASHRSPEPIRKLHDAHQRVVALRGRIRAGEEDGVVEELESEVGQFSDLLPALLDTQGAGRTVEIAEPCMWPKDLNAESDEPSDWGRDPTDDVHD